MKEERSDETGSWALEHGWSTLKQHLDQAELSAFPLDCFKLPRVPRLSKPQAVTYVKSGRVELFYNVLKNVVEKIVCYPKVAVLVLHFGVCYFVPRLPAPISLFYIIQFCYLPPETLK